jgi:hypothetical protein
MSYHEHKPEMQIWRLPIGVHWAVFPPHGGALGDTKAEATARLKAAFPEITTWIVNDHTADKPSEQPRNEAQV